MIAPLVAKEHMMSAVGNFPVDIAIEHIARRGELRTIENALVDTDNEFTWIPTETLEQLGVGREREQRFILSDGRVVERSVGMAIVYAEGASAPDWVVFAEPGDVVSLGAHSLSGMNLRVDPKARRLVPGGPIITAAA